MSQVAFQPDSSIQGFLKTGQHEDLSQGAISDYPMLGAVARVWEDSHSAAGQLPARLDPLSLPRGILPYVMLLDLEQVSMRPRLRIRLAGTEVCAKHGREMKGLTTDDFFQADDADAVVAAALAVARTRRPSLARRSYVTLHNRTWSYTRLILPLSRDGEAVDSYFKVADPASMRRVGGEPSPRPAC